jgi:hypothetical protein
MKKEIILLLSLIIIFPLISAIDISMESNIPKGETVIASFSGNFVDSITKSNVYFYRGHVRTSFDYDIAKIGENYYIYFQTVGKAENNYSINISGVRYMTGSQVSSQQISKSFSIISKTADFSVTPGFVITNGNFSINVQNIKSSPIVINLETEVNSGSSQGFFGFLFKGDKVERSISLLSGETKTLYIELEGISETTIRNIRLSTNNTEYNIPSYVIVENTIIIPPKENNTITNQTNNSKPNQTNISNNNQTSNHTNNENNSGSITYPNEEEKCSFFGRLFGTCANNVTENGTQKNETFSNGTIKNQTSYNNTFSNGTLKNNSSSNPGYEVIKSGNKTIAIKNGTILNGSATSKTCVEIKGYICSSGEICQNTTIYAKDAKCCISKCVKEESKTNGKIIGWAIIGFLFILIIRFFVVKFKGMKKKNDPILNTKK